MRRVSPALGVALLAASGVGAQPAMFPDRQFDAALGRLTDLAHSPDGRLLAASSSSGGVGVWDAQTGKLVRSAQLATAAILRIAFDAQGNQLAAAGRDGTVGVLDLRTGQKLDVTRHRKEASSLALSPDGSLGASGDAGGEIHLWDPQGGAVSALGGGKSRVLQLGFTEPATLLSIDEDLEVVTWDARGRRALRRSTLRSGGATTSVAEAASLEAGRAFLAVSLQDRVAPAGGALTGRRGMARPNDLERRNVVVPYAVETGITAGPVSSGEYLAERLALAPGGCFAFYASFRQGQARLHVLDLVRQGGGDVQRLDLEARVAAVAVEPGGRQVAVAFESGWLRTYKASGAGPADCETWRARETPPRGGGPRIALGAETQPLVPAGAGYRLAVLGFEAGGVESHVADAVAEMIAGELSNSPHLQVVERGRIEAIVRELEIQRSGLTTADAVRVGRGLNARKVLFGSVRRFGEGTFVVLARMVDVETQRVEGTRQVTCEGCGPQDLPRAVQVLTRAIVP